MTAAPRLVYLDTEFDPRELNRYEVRHRPEPGR